MQPHFQFLTTTQLLYRKSIDFFSWKPKPSRTPKIDTTQYVMRSDLTKMSSGTHSTMGAFEDKKSKKTVFIKKYFFQTKGLRYGSLLNEISILHLLKEKKLLSFPEQKFIIPGLIETTEESEEITLICEYRPGKVLMHASEQEKKQALIKVLNVLKIMSKKLEHDLSLFPSRTNTLIACVFPYFLIKATLKTPSQILRNIKIGLIFYTFYWQTRSEKNIYGLVHRDLHSQNILYENDLTIMTDWEGAAMMDSTYDLAMIGRLYFGEISPNTFSDIRDALLKSTQEKKRFAFLTLYHSIQTLAVDATNTISYPPTQRYIEHVLSDIIPSIVEEKSAQ